MILRTTKSMNLLSNGSWRDGESTARGGPGEQLGLKLDQPVKNSCTVQKLDGALVLNLHHSSRPCRCVRPKTWSSLSKPKSREASEDWLEARSIATFVRMTS